MSSEIIRLRQQIEEEYQSAKFALNGVAITARHDFINARYRRIDTLYIRLVDQVGEEKATDVLNHISNIVMG